MNQDRTAAIAIATGVSAGLLTMASHPTGHDVIRNASAGDSNVLNVAAHTLAIVAQPLILAGALAITARLKARPDLSIGAYVFFALAGVAVIIAAVASGYMAPASLHGYASADAAERSAMMNALHYTGVINQAFAKVHVALSSIAILLWSIAILKGGGLARGLGIYGVIVSTLLLIGIGSGVLTLDIHGFGLVVLTQGAWLVLAARELWNTPDPPVKAVL